MSGFYAEPCHKQRQLLHKSAVLLQVNVGH